MRLADLQREYGERLVVEWRAYLLQPNVHVKPLDPFRNYTRRWALGPGALEPRTIFNVWGDSAPPTHSMPAAIAGKVAATFGPDAFDAFHLELMRAYFTENRTISELDVIVAVATTCGLDTELFRARMRSLGPALHAEAIADMEAGVELGVHGAPTVVINGTLPIPGAQELDSYRSMIDRILART